MGLFSKKNKDSKQGTRNKGDERDESGATSDKTRQVTLDNGQSYLVSQTVDCFGDSCPRPQLMTKKALSSSESNDVVEIMVDNPTSMEALPPLCAGLNATHLETTNVKNGWHVYIQKN